jgi:hypothetical protein
MLHCQPPFFVQNLATNNTTCLQNVTKQVFLGFLIAKLRHFWPQLPTFKPQIILWMIATCATIRNLKKKH